MKDDIYLMPKLAIMFTLLCFAFLGGSLYGRKLMMRNAVKIGVAEFRATPEGDVTFHWKEPKP